MRLQDLNWMDVENYLTQDNRIMLITGATEQHAYLSLLTDILIPTKIADAVAQREPILIAPPLNFGVSRYFLEFPGTISLSQQTFDFALLEIVESLLHQGFRKFFVLNGHGGNRLPERLEDFTRDGIIQVHWYDWWRKEVTTSFAEKHGLQTNHANWSENFPFNRVAESPASVKESVNMSFFELGHSAREHLGDGNFGGHYQVDDALMYALFDAVVDDVTDIIKRMRDDD